MMQDLVQIKKRPSWLKVKVENGNTYQEVRDLLADLKLNTVCEDARCPNIWECWGRYRTATMMILGDVCTRACKYCSVTSGQPKTLPDSDEPQRVAEAVVRLGLQHVVITSVDRDDLADYGSMHFVQTMQAIRQRLPTCKIELLIPDFMGQIGALQQVFAAKPDVLGHNIETVPRLYKRMRSKGIYERALQVLAVANAYRQKHALAMTTKTGLMVGLGEEIAEVEAVMDDLRQVHCDVLTIGQYLNPSRKHAQVEHFYAPEVFEQLKAKALAKGFLHVESGPLVRSSYHAHEHIPKVS